VKCKTCNDSRVFTYYGQIATCADCSDNLNIVEYIEKLQKKVEILEAALGYYLPILEEELSCGAYARQVLQKAKELR